MLNKPVKMDQTEGLPDSCMSERPSVKFGHRPSFASPLFFFLQQPIERLEEALD